MIEQNLNQNKKNKLVFIRHGQSLSNKAVHDFREERNLPDCWKTFHSIDDFNHKVIYNPDLCDSGLSPKGQTQCLQAKQKLKDIKIDLILVSPLQRALQTCQKIFSQRFQNVDIIVEPLLAQSMKYSSDISRKISDKELKFPKYNFSKVKQQGDFWFIKNDNEQNQKLYFQHLNNYVHLSYEQKQKQIAKFMCLTHLRQSNLNVRKRVIKIKLKLKQYSQKYNHILIVSHYYTIRHIFAKNISITGQPLDQFHGPNCCIHEEYLQNLLKEQQIQNKI